MSDQRSVRVEYIGFQQRPYSGKTVTGRIYIGAIYSDGRNQGKWVPDVYKDAEWAKKALSLFVSDPISKFQQVEPGIFTWETFAQYTD